MAYTVWLKAEIINVPIEHATITEITVTGSLKMYQVDGQIKKTKQIFKESQNHWNMVPEETYYYEDISLIVNSSMISKIKNE